LQVNGGLAIAKAIASHNTLVNLSLSDNNFQNEAIIAIANTLKGYIAI
jgi:hypothetical protein